MLIVRQAWRVVAPGFDETERAVSHHAEQRDAEAEAARLNRTECSSIAWYRAEPCWVLEVRGEKGESLVFDLGSSVIVR